MRRRLDPTAGVVGAITLVGLGLRLAILARPISVVDRLFVPDDTYYTLTIARSIAEGHGPTVDGRTLTSGFQPLLGFLMVPVYWVTGDLDAALRIDLALLVVVDTATIALLAWVAFRVAGPVAGVVAAALWALSPIAISMALGGLETSLAILAAVALVAVWLRAEDTEDRGRWIAVGAVAGLAVLARIDIALLVVILAGLQVWRGPRRGLLTGAAAGAVVVAPWWIWCTIELGTPIPTSGSAAHDLATVAPFSRDAFAQVTGAVAGGPFTVWDGARDLLAEHPTLGTLVFLVAVGGLLAAAVVLATRVRRAFAVAALPGFAAGLLVFYAWFGVGWYFTRYLAPVAAVVTLLLAIGVGRLAAAEAPWRTPALAGVALLAIVPVAAMLGGIRAALRDTERTPSDFDTVTGYREPALAVTAHPPDGAVMGAWQSGAFGYYADDRFRVVNLDGVVNPDAHAAQREGRIAEYAREQGIEWLADFELFLVRFELVDAKDVRPRPRFTAVPDLPQFTGFPTYAMSEVRWSG